MSPVQGNGLLPRVAGSDPPTVREAVVLEGWAEGFRLVPTRIIFCAIKPVFSRCLHQLSS